MANLFQVPAQHEEAAAVAEVLGSLLEEVSLEEKPDPQANKAVSDDLDWQCAICLNEIALPELATIKGCEHVYCVKCVLQWATSRSNATCPTCKAPFEALLVHRDVDGSLSDAPICLTIGFLARAPWYLDWVREQSQIRDLHRYPLFRSVDMAADGRSPLAIAQEEWAEDAMYQYYEEQCEDEDELEEYYIHRASSSRPTFGNRPWGPDGYVSSGRRRAAPVQHPRSGKGSVKGRAHGKGSSSSSNGSSGSGAGTSMSAQKAGYEAEKCGKGGASTSQGAQGRRAKRRAKRAAAVEDEMY